MALLAMPEPQAGQFLDGVFATATAVPLAAAAEMRYVERAKRFCCRENFCAELPQMMSL